MTRATSTTNATRTGNAVRGSKDDVDSYNTSRTISSIGLIGGAVLVGAGAVLYFTADSGEPSREQARVGAFFNGQQVGLTGRFQ